MNYTSLLSTTTLIKDFVLHKNEMNASMLKKAIHVVQKGWIPDYSTHHLGKGQGQKQSWHILYTEGLTAPVFAAVDHSLKHVIQ